MREILFRAKSKNYRLNVKDKHWVYGSLVRGEVLFPKKKEEYFIVELSNRGSCTYEVEPGTLCQYTGMNDKNGKRIWENDIVKHERSDTIGTVKWYQEDYVGWCVDDVCIDEQQFTDEMWNECEVVGDIFDTPELLKGEE